jgi:hypothetical protein
MTAGNKISASDIRGFIIAFIVSVLVVTYLGKGAKSTLKTQ